MKIKCEITAVETDGENLVIRMQGSPPNAAEWRRLEVQKIVIPASKPSQRTFYIGRNVDIIVNPR